MHSMQDVDRLPGPGEAGLEHHEAGLHEEHQERRDQRPAVFSGLTMSSGFGASDVLCALATESKRARDVQRDQQQHDAEHLAGEKHDEEATRFLLTERSLQLA